MEFTDREWKLMQQVEKLKSQVKKQSIEIADLKAQKKTLENKLKIANESIEDLRKLNKEKENDKLKLDISILKAELDTANKELSQSNKIVTNLKTRLNKDSSNSSKPSSTDSIYKKKIHINSSRQKGGKTGGQFGHKGVTLSDEYIKELIKDGKVKHVIKDLGDVNNPNYKSKFVCDVEIMPVVTEYRYHINEKGKYEIPKKMYPVVQYGELSKSLIMYITDEIMAPINKCALFMQNITDGCFKYSEGTIVKVQKEADTFLIPIVEDIKQKLIEVKILHVDETGVRVNGVLKWLHAYCSGNLYYYQPHEKRGTEAIEDIGIIEYFTNILVHDHWKSYYTKGNHLTHAECNAHILRYLKGVLEIVKSEDVENLIKLFVEMNEAKKKAIGEEKTSFSEEEMNDFRIRYDQLLSSWGKDLNARINKTDHPEVYDDERNLHDRLEEYKEEHLLFIKDYDVPFDNNAGERAIRMVKGKVNACGGFRTVEGIERFANARSFMMTCKHSKENILKNLVNLFSQGEYNIA